MLPFCPVLFYSFPEALTTKTIVILGAHRDCIHGQPEHQPSLQSKGMCLGGGIYDQLLDWNIGMKPLVSRPCSDNCHERRIGCRSLSSSACESSGTCSPTDLYHATSHPSGVVEIFAQPKELSRPIHYHSLQLGACGATVPLHPKSVGLARYRFEGIRTLKPGFSAVVAYKSPMIPSKLEAVG